MLASLHSQSFCTLLTPPKKPKTGSLKTISLAVITSKEETEFELMFAEISSLPSDTFFKLAHLYFAANNIWQSTKTGVSRLELGSRAINNCQLRIRYFTEMIRKYNLKVATTNGTIDINRLFAQLIQRDDVHQVKLLFDTEMFPPEKFDSVAFLLEIIQKRAMKCFEFASGHGIYLPALAEIKARNVFIVKKALDQEFHDVGFYDSCREHDISLNSEHFGDGNNILHYISQGKLSCPESLSRTMVEWHLSNVNEENERGETPLLIAIKDGNYCMVKALLDNGVDVTAEDKSGMSLLCSVLAYQFHRKLLDFPCKTEAINAMNTYLCRHGRIRDWFTWVVQSKGGVIEMFEKSKFIDIISFKTMEIGSENLKLLNQRMGELGAKMDLFSHFCTWNDLQTLQSYESIDVRIKGDYKSILQKLQSQLQTWIKLNIASRFAGVKGFSKLWVLSLVEFL